MPDFGAVLVAVTGALLPPINAACADALAASLLSGEGECDSSFTFPTTSSFLVDCSMLGAPNMVIGRGLGFGGSSSVGGSTSFLSPPDIVPGGSSILLLFDASFFGSCEGIGSREGDSSMAALFVVASRRYQDTI